MTTDTKLTKVLEYLIKNDEEKARELLHQVFIEKARAIHEELMSADESAEEEMDEMHDHMHDEMDEMVGGSGDMGKDLTNEIKAMDDEITSEETMSEDDSDVEDEADVEVDAEETSEPAADSADFEAVEDKMSDLEAALAALKAEFEKLEAGSEEESDEETVDFDMKSDEEGEEEEGEEEEGEEEEGEEEMDEAWELDEDFDDLAESLDLEVVTKDMEKSAQTPTDVGSASSGMGLGKDAKSPTPPSQTTRFGAKPVAIGQGPDHKGYNLETAPKSDKLPIEPNDNRRKKATQDTKKMSKEGAPSAKLNHPEPAKGNTMSPLSKGGDNLK